MFATLDDLGTCRRALVRLDLNSPVEGGAVKDNRRFARHAVTVRELLDREIAVAVLAHQGRPGRETFVSLDQHADILAEHLDGTVRFVDDVYGERALTAIRGLEPGEALLLENVRMAADELPERDPAEHAESDMVRTLAPLFDCYVNDAYSAAHRAHASLVGFPLVMPAYAGRVMEAEYEANTSIARRDVDGDVVMVLGGTKATDVIEVMGAVGDRVDRFLLGGVAGELFLRAAGVPVGRDVGGSDLFDDQWAANRVAVESVLDDRRDAIELPIDLAYEDDGDRAEVAVEAIDEKSMSFLDVGHGTIDTYAPVLRDAAMVFVKGALGVFEDERFAAGTVETLRAIAESDCFSVVGGGDTSRAIDLYGLDETAFSHVSIAGGAYLRALTGDPLPAIEVLAREHAGAG